VKTIFRFDLRIDPGGAGDFTAGMRFAVCLLGATLLGAGCAGPGVDPGKTHFNPGPGAAGLLANPKESRSKLIITPETVTVGKVVRVNQSARFAVLNFPLGIMPAPQQKLNVYRQGLKVGEMKVTGPQQEDNTVGDIVAGEAQVGDELRPD
jgi:hypothetical protein